MPPTGWLTFSHPGQPTSREGATEIKPSITLPSPLVSYWCSHWTTQPRARGQRSPWVPSRQVRILGQRAGWTRAENRYREATRRSFSTWTNNFKIFMTSYFRNVWNWLLFFFNTSEIMLTPHRFRAHRIKTQAAFPVSFSSSVQYSRLLLCFIWRTSSIYLLHHFTKICNSVRLNVLTFLT